MIYFFLDREPNDNEIEYKRGICRIWPINELEYYMDPAPNEGAGIFSIIPNQKEVKGGDFESDFIKILSKRLKEMEIGNKAKKYRKGSRIYLANHKRINEFKLQLRNKSKRITKNIFNHNLQLNRQE